MIEPSTWFPFRKWCAAKQFTPQHGYKLIKQGKLHTVTSGNRRYVTEAEDRRFDQVCAEAAQVPAQVKRQHGSLRA